MTGNKSKFTAKKMKPRKAGAAELAEEDLDRITGGAHDTFLELDDVPGESTDASKDPAKLTVKITPERIR